MKVCGEFHENPFDRVSEHVDLGEKNRYSMWSCGADLLFREERRKARDGAFGRRAYGRREDMGKKV